MKKLLVLFSLILVGAISTSTPADAHSKKRTKYGTVQCLDYTSRQISLSYCNAHTDALGSQPARPTKRCSVSHRHATTSPQTSPTGSIIGYDVTGDNVGDFETLEEANAFLSEYHDREIEYEQDDLDRESGDADGNWDASWDEIAEDRDNYHEDLSEE